MTSSDQSRDLSTYLTALWSRPGARLQLLAILGFGFPVAVKSGVLVALAILLDSIGFGATYGYRRFKRTGRVY